MIKLLIRLVFLFLTTENTEKAQRLQRDNSLCDYCIFKEGFSGVISVSLLYFSDF